MDIIELIKQDKPLFLKRPDIEVDIWHRFIKFIGEDAKGLYICTSGTSSQKLTILNISHETMLSHAQAFGDIFSIGPQQTWLQSLPFFYMGGISLFYRAYALEGRVRINEDFSIEKIIESSDGCDYLSLVPRQIFDFIEKKLILPSSVKMVLIGGDRLPDSLERKLDSNIFFKTYGLSESCGQLATSRVNTEGIELLPFAKVLRTRPFHFVTPYHYDYLYTLETDGFKSSSYPGFIETKDYGSLSDNSLIIEGRLGRKVKINARFYHLDDIESQLEVRTTIPFFISSDQDEKYGAVISVYSLEPIDQNLLRSLHIKRNYLVDKFLYTQSGKMIKTANHYLVSKTMEIY